MRETKERGATRFPSLATPGVGKPDEVVDKTTNDNLSLEGRIVNRTMKLFNTDSQDFFLSPNGESSCKTTLLIERLHEALVGGGSK